MKDSKLRQLVKESLDQNSLKPTDNQDPRKDTAIQNILGGKMNLTAEEFEKKAKDKNDEIKLAAFKKAYERGNTDSQTSLETLLDQEPYSQMEDWVTKYKKDSKQYQADIASGKTKSTITGKSSVGGDRGSDSGSSSSRIAGMTGLFEEQLRMQFLAGIITEAEYKEKLDEGIKDITAGVLIALSSLLGGKSIAQEIAPINNFQQPNRSELKIAQSLKQDLENENTYKRVDTLINTAADKIAGEDIGDDFEQLIHTKYYNDQGEWIGQVMQQKSRKDGVDQERVHNYSKSSGGEFINLDDKSIEDAVATSKTEVKELQNELDQFLENFKSDVAAGKASGTELGLNYRGKIEQLENKIEKLQKKYPQLKFSGMDYSDYKYFKGKNSGDGRLIDILNSLENGKYGMDAKLSFEDDWGRGSDLGYKMY